MAHIYKLGDRWRAQVERRSTRLSRTFRAKAEAEQWAHQVEGEILGGRVRTHHTLRDGLLRYLREVSPGKRGHRWEAVRLRRLADEPMARGRMGDVAPRQVAAYRDKRLGQVGPATVSRELNVLSSVYQAARKDWGWVDKNPVREIRWPGEPPPKRPRWDDAEARRLLGALGYRDDPGWRPDTMTQEAAVAFLFALETAMRRTELLTLAPEQVVGSVAHLDQTKNGDRRDVPLSREARRLWGLLPAGRFRVSPGSLDVLFRKAAKRAGVGLRFHDTRKEATRRLSKKLDVLELATVTGHRDLRVLIRRYYSTNAGELAEKLG